MSDNYFSTTAFNKRLCVKAKSIFSALAVKAEVAERDGGSGERRRRGEQPGAHIRSCPGLWVTLVLAFTEAQVRLISGRALHHLYTLLRNLFSGYQLLYFNIASWLWGALREGLQKSIRFYNFYLGRATTLYLHCT